MDIPAQGAEIWEELGEWIVENKPQFGPGTKERFQMTSSLQPEEVQQLTLTLQLPSCASWNALVSERPAAMADCLQKVQTCIC